MSVKQNKKSYWAVYFKTEKSQFQKIWAHILKFKVCKGKVKAWKLIKEFLEASRMKSFTELVFCQILRSIQLQNSFGLFNVKNFENGMVYWCIQKLKLYVFPYF